MRKIRFSLLTALALASLSPCGFADLVTLKSGEKIEGRVTEETATEVTVDVKVSAGISDTRTVPKAEVASIEKAAPDEAAWQAIKSVRLGTNSLSAAGYDATTRALNGFINQFPASTHLAEVKKTLADYESEKARVAAGEVKLNNEWLSKEEVARERYQINARLAYNHMKEQGTGGDLPGALNTFDAIEKQFPGARVYPDAVEFARRIVPALKAEVERRQKQLTTDLADRAKGMQLSSIEKRAEDEAALKREQATLEATMAAAEKAQIKWVPLLPRSVRSLTNLAARTGPEIQRLAAIDLAKLRQSLKLTDEAQTAINAKDFGTAVDSLTQAKTLWPANELATRLQPIAAAAKTAAPAVVAAAPVAAAATPSAEAAPAAQPAAKAIDYTEKADDEKSFLATPAGIITVLIALGLVWVALSTYRKLKGRANEVLE